MKLLGSTESKITKYENGKNIPRLEVTEVVLIHCNIAISDYQHDTWVLCTFFPNRPFRQLLDILSKTQNFHILKCAGQNHKQLEIQDKINLSLVIN